MINDIKINHNIKRSGFSFLEVMAVLVIIALVMTISLPTFSLITHSSLEKEAQKIASLVHNIRYESILSGITHKIVIQVSKNQYLIQKQSSDTGRWENIESKKISKNPVVIEEDVKFHGVQWGSEETKFRDVEVFIRPSGFVDLFRIYFSKDKKQISFEVYGVLGRTKISEEQDLTLLPFEEEL